MKPKDFVEKYLPAAKTCEYATGISAVFTLAQAALESGWGERALGNNFFGIKAGGVWKGKTVLMTTTEWHNDDKHVYHAIHSITKVGDKYKYKVDDLFRAYDTPEESFTDHSFFFINNKRYAEALKDKSDPILFAEAIAKAGYATAPDYAETLKDVVKSVLRVMPG